jgi:hypothetical protein
VLELSWFAAESDACSTHAQANCSFWMDLGFSLPGKSNDTYPQHHEKVSILAEEIGLLVIVSKKIMEGALSL